MAAVQRLLEFGKHFVPRGEQAKKFARDGNALSLLEDSQTPIGRLVQTDAD